MLPVHWFSGAFSGYKIAQKLVKGPHIVDFQMLRIKENKRKKY